MNKEEQLEELEASMMTISTITCETCEEEESAEYDEAQWFYDKGWRVIDGETLCKKCRKNLNKKKKK